MLGITVKRQLSPKCENNAEPRRASGGESVADDGAGDSAPPQTNGRKMKPFLRPESVY